MNVHLATAADLRFILQQQRQESNALGFVPRPRLEWAVEHNRILIASAGSQRLGYTFIGSTRSGILPIHQCVTEAGVRRRTVGEAFAASVVKIAMAANCRAVRCNCRDDLEANAFWQAIGFELSAQRPGGAGRGGILNTYSFLLDYTDYVDYTSGDGNDAVPEQESVMKQKKPTSVRLDQPARDILKSLQKEWQCAQSDVLTALLKEAGLAQMRRANRASPAEKPTGWRKALKEKNGRRDRNVVKEGK
jgi:hypothetical protein